MKKFFIYTITVLSFANVAVAKTPDEMCAKYQESAQKQIAKVENYKTYTEQMKKIKIDFIKNESKLKCDFQKSLAQAKEQKKAEKAKQRAEKKANKTKKSA